MLAEGFEVGSFVSRHSGETAKQLLKDLFKVPGDELKGYVKRSHVSRDALASFTLAQQAQLVAMRTPVGPQTAGGVLGFIVWSTRYQGW